jgi:hypothetical protein
MRKCRAYFMSASAVGLLGLGASTSYGQAASALYTWDNTGNAAPNVESWVKNFGTNTATLSNSVLGSLTITETGTAGEDIAITDGGNRIRESILNGSGGTDVTGLDFMEFDLGHNGSGPINVQFFVQAGPGFSFVSLGPDLAVTPGVNTYQVPITGLTADQAVYVRTMGFNVRDHLAMGNVTWTLNEVRTGGTPLTTRTLITHDGSVEGGLQGAYANFDVAAIQGNDGGQNQSGLSWNSAGTGSLQWTDLGGSQGAAINWGNGTAWNGNTFNNREADLSNYQTVTFRVSATDPQNGGGTIGFNAFVQTNNFQFQSIDGGVGQNIPIDGAFHDVTFSLAGLVNMNGVDATGINLFAHAQNLVMNVDSITFNVPEPGSAAIIGVGMGLFGMARRRRA